MEDRGRVGKTELDLHTHTIASGHASTDTILDMVRTAGERGLRLLGISEHGPAMPGSCGISYFRNLSLVPRNRMGVELLLGAELNILDDAGSLDLPESVLSRLDYTIASMHPNVLSPGTEEKNTRRYLSAMKNPHVNIIGHCDDARYPVNYRDLVDAAAEYNVLLEINNSSLSPQGYRGHAEENDLIILELCRQRRHPVLFSSDSHGTADIGNLSYAVQLAQSIDFPEELILNYSLDRWKQHIHQI